MSGHIWRCPLCHRLNNRFIYGDECPECNGSDEDLSNQSDNDVAKQNRSLKTSAVPAADEKHPQSKRMHAHTTTADSRIGFSERPYRALFITADVFRQFDQDDRLNLDAVWKRGDAP